MQRMESPPGAARTVAVAFITLLAGIVVGRLILERTGTGFAILLVALPIVFILLAALFGVGRGAFLVSLFAATALLVRVVALQSGWVVLLLVPVVGMTFYVLANTIIAMRLPADAGRSGSEEE